MKKTSMPNSVKSLGYISKSLGYISSATARVAPDPLKALRILSDTTVRRSAVNWEDLKQC